MPECAYIHDRGPEPATVEAPQSDDGGLTVDRWAPICDADAETWFEGSHWTPETIAAHPFRPIGR